MQQKERLSPLRLLLFRSTSLQLKSRKEDVSSLAHNFPWMMQLFRVVTQSSLHNENSVNFALNIVLQWAAFLMPLRPSQFQPLPPWPGKLPMCLKEKLTTLAPSSTCSMMRFSKNFRKYHLSYLFGVTETCDSGTVCDTLPRPQAGHQLTGLKCKSQNDMNAYENGMKQSKGVLWKPIQMQFINHSRAPKILHVSSLLFSRY